MNTYKLLLRYLLLIIAVAATSCHKENYEDIYTPGGRKTYPAELSAGNSTTFTFTSVAYDTPSGWIDNNSDMHFRFLEGDALYDDPFVEENGLGPVYCGYSCGSCHVGAGRSKSSLHEYGGSGLGFSSFLTFIRTPNNQYHKEYGRVLHDQAIKGATPEGKLKVEYTNKEYSFPDGEKYVLRTPKYRIEDWYATDIKVEDLEMSVRTPLRHVGLGLMMALDHDELKKLAATHYPEFGISGEINYVMERGKREIGITGHKAQHSDLTIELGFLSDMGITNDRFPFEVSHGQPQVTEDYEIQITSEDMAKVDFYLHSLGVPARRNVKSAAVKYGEKMFYRAKCQLCHTPTLHTRKEGATLIDGTPMPWLGGQTIHPYSDFLLHDMGPELGDDFAQFNASGDEWRTTPLWGIGLQETVNQHTDFLHDARARNYVEAIMWHGGEGDVSRQIFYNMKKSDRDALVQFLKSL